MSQLKYNEDGDIDLTVGEPTAETTQDPSPQTTIEEPPVEPQQDPNPAQEPVQDPSSLTVDPPQPPVPPVQETVVQEQPTAEINDDVVLQFLSDRQGTPITTLDDLFTEPEPIVNPLDEDPQLKEIYEWRKRTGRPVTDWAKFQKDYNAMSDVDVAREILQLRYNLTPAELDLEMANYIPSETDLDEDKARKSLNLKKFAVDGRKELNNLRSEFDTTLPGVQASLTTEQQQKIDFYNTYQQEQANAQQAANSYNESVKNTIQGFQSIPLKLDNDLTIDYNLTTDNKTTLQEFMNMPHWFNEDGSYNFQSVVADSVFLQNKDKIIELAYQQGIAKGKEQEDVTSRNITLQQSRQTMDTAVTESNKIILEGAENFNSPRGTKIRFKTR